MITFLILIAIYAAKSSYLAVFLNIGRMGAIMKLGERAFKLGFILAILCVGSVHLAYAATVYSQPYVGTNIQLGTSEPGTTRYQGYYFKGATVGNPPTEVDYWTSTSVINKMMVKRVSGASCNTIAAAANIIDQDGYNITSFSFHGATTGDNCEMTTLQSVPIGTKIAAVFLTSGNVGANDMVVDGSPSNEGTSLNVSNDGQTNGGFAFQFCDNEVCDQSFIPATPLPPLPCTTDCYSNVLFLPGIKGSILEKGSDIVWPPTIFSVNDVSQLALTDSGESLNDIHTDGILNKFYTTSIYSQFSSFMDGIAGDNKLIKEWLPLAYDWRFSPETILEDGIKTADKTIDVIEEIEKLAENSKTGKVTIVAHSMGGLLGKAVIKKLQDEGKDDLIDSFVMVGTPQLGTPQAVASILHGDGEGIAVGFITNPIGIRRIAQNMPSAYNLLPSPAYFDKVSDPVISFNAQAPFTQTWRNFWGQTINNYSNFLSFTTGTGVMRTKPEEAELKKPEVLQSDLMTDASDFHNQYDNYTFPSHIRVVQVAGWGVPTTKAVEYLTYHGYSSYDTKFTIEGDSTVVYASAVSSTTDETYFFDVEKYRKNENNSTQHRDLLSADAMQTLLTSIIKKEGITENNFISSIKPEATNVSDKLIISTHSPVILGAYDQFGNFTGIDPTQDLSADILSISENIPGSIFTYTGESQNIFLPKEGNYNFIYKGTGVGPTTVTIKTFVADVAEPVVSYTDIPTTSSTSAAFTVQSTAPENTAIAVDNNSDGTTDTIVPADGNQEVSLNELIVLIKGKISTLNIKDKLRQSLLKQIANLEKKIENKKQRNLKVIANLSKKISKQELRGKISAVDAAGIMSLLDLLEAQAENVALDPMILADLKTKIQSLNIKANLKSDLLKRVENLDKKQQLIKTLSGLSKKVANKALNGKINDIDAQALLDILAQIEVVI